MADAKPDNSTHGEIKSLSDKFDRVHQRIEESSTDLQEEIDKKFAESKVDRLADKEEVAKTLKEDRDRNRWVIGTIVAIAVVAISWYLESVRSELITVTGSVKETNAAINSLVDTTYKQAGKIDVLNVRLDQQAKMESLFQSLEKEVQGMKIEIERLKKQ